MFTGLIRHLGTVSRRTGAGITVACPDLSPKLALGDSVAVNGACLTVTKLDKQGFSADLLPETGRDSTLGSLESGTQVNLELPLAAGEALGGHFVQGHVDGVVRLLSKSEGQDGNWLLRFENPEWLAPLIPPKASIAIDGISLTVQDSGRDEFAVAIIPTTYSETNVHNISPGSRVNIEADMIVKSVVHALKAIGAGKEPLTVEKLKQMGYLN